MSYFLFTARHALPEHFRESIPVTDKQAIVEKLVVESFLTQDNWFTALAEMSIIPILLSVDTVEDYILISKKVLPTEEDANNLVTYFNAQREKNKLHRDWDHSEETTSIKVTPLSEAEFLALAEEDHPAINFDNIKFN
jgi:hypothetical protein